MDVEQSTEHADCDILVTITSHNQIVDQASNSQILLSGQ